MSWFKREENEYGATTGTDGAADTDRKTVRTEGLWIKCVGCRAVIFKADLEANLNVCPKCQHHFKIDARQRIGMLLEPGYELVDGGLRSTDPLNFTDIKPYKQRLRAAQAGTGLDDAILNAVGQLGTHSVVVSAMEYSFIGGSTGAGGGGKPRIVVAASGGGRMMEGVASLMQMAKISSALAQLDDARVPYICLLTDPTLGGVTG